MQQVLNRADRNQAFVKFLVFFLITIVLIVAAVFVNYQLPARENKRLREQAELQRQQDNSELKFISVMQEAVTLLDSMEKGGPQVDLLRTQLDGKIIDLEKLEQNNNTIYGQLNKVVASKLNELELKKLRVNEISSKLSSTSGLQAELDKCKTDMETLKRDNDNLRTRLPN
jgi:cell division protein FtsL